MAFCSVILQIQVPDGSGFAFDATRPYRVTRVTTAEMMQIQRSLHTKQPSLQHNTSNCHHLVQLAAASRRTACICQASASPGGTQGQQLNVVITGGTKGLGYCMATEFLKAGDNVVICGRDAERLQAALSNLQPLASAQPQQPLVSGVVCDVSVAADVDKLQAHVAQSFGQGPVHRWINNAGQVTRKKLLHELQPADIASAVGCNVLGSLLCCRAAIALMKAHHEQQQGKVGDAAAAPAAQQPLYHIFNMGFSQWGASATKSACTHKATKMALTQLNKSLAEELQEAGMNYIGVHNLSPGMVLTDLLLQGAPVAARRFFNALAEEPDTVAAVLVPQIRSIQGSSSPIEFLTPLSAVGRVLTGVPQIINGGRFFDKAGNRVQTSGSRPAVFNSAGTRLLYDFPDDKY